MKAKILWVEGKRAESPSFVPGLRKKGYTVETVGSGEEALAALASFDPDLVIVNAASLRTSGKRICREIRKHSAGAAILLIAAAENPTRGYAPANLVITAPYQSAKVVQQLKTLSPGDDGRLLWVKGKNSANSVPITDLRKREFSVETAMEKDETAGKLSEFHPTLVVIDTISLGAAGKAISRMVHTREPGTPIALITVAEAPAANEAPANVVLMLPFTLRKLLNRIKPLLPGDGSSLLHTGPIRLDLELKRVHCQGRETTLTPRLAQLLKIFMGHPGEALERERLFREVWNTEYTGDTRTLDVHISWLRQALEEDPRNPRFLKTIRGLGYRLDV